MLALFCFTAMVSKFQIGCRILVAVGFTGPWGNEARLFIQAMGIVMKKLVLAAAVLALTAGSALAADMGVKAVKAPPPARVRSLGFRLRRRAS